MIKASVYKENDIIYGITLDGHAGAGRKGFDIVCSAVSILVINTINSIEQFTEDGIRLEADEKKGGHLDFEITDVSPENQLLLRSMVLGLTQMENEYGKYLKVDFREVKK